MSVLNDRKLLSKQEAASVLSVSTRTVERMFAHGELTKVKIRGCVRARLDEVQRLLGGGASV